jgi:tetratricopeptide (TPR) repeat protein
MIRSPFFLILGGALLSCASPGLSSRAVGHVSDPSLLQQSSTGSSEGSRASEAPAASPEFGEEEHRYWNSPAFRRALSESYVAETEVEPPVTADERLRLERIFALMAEDRIDQALERLAAETGPATSAVFDFTRGGLLFQREELDAAAVSLERAVEKYPKYRRAWRTLGLVRARTGEHAAAAAALTKVIEGGGGDGYTYGALGLAYLGLGNFLSAESAFRMAALLDAETVDWQLGLAQALFQQERFPEASAVAGSLIERYPERADFWLLQAQAFLNLEQPLRAAQNFEMVDRLGRATPESLFALGDIYLVERLADQSLLAYTKAVDLAPGENLARAVRSARQLGTYGAPAESALLAAHVEQVAGDNLPEEQRLELLHLRARLALGAGDGAEEARLLTEIVAHDPLDGEALILLGQHSARTGDLEQAIHYFERAASLEQFEVDANVRHAQALVAAGRYADAVPLLTRAQSLRPTDHVQRYLEGVQRAAGRP